MLTRYDGTVWLVGGAGEADVSQNTWAIVRNSWTRAGNTTPTNRSQPITQFDVATLPQ
jgi:hypothetical protein